MNVGLSAYHMSSYTWNVQNREALTGRIDSRLFSVGDEGEYVYVGKGGNS